MPAVCPQVSSYLRRLHLAIPTGSGISTTDIFNIWGSQSSSLWVAGRHSEVQSPAGDTDAECPAMDGQQAGPVVPQFPHL